MWLNYCILPAGIKKQGTYRRKSNTENSLSQRTGKKGQPSSRHHSPSCIFNFFFFLLLIYKGLWTCECKTGNAFSSAEFSPSTFHQLHFSPHSYSDQTAFLTFFFPVLQLLTKIDCILYMSHCISLLCPSPWYNTVNMMLFRVSILTFS